MGKTNRNAPKRAASSESRYSLMEFEREFPDDATCLEYLVGKLYPDGIFCPKDGRVTKHHRLKNRPAYSCQFCGRHEYPLKGTIFERSSTSLYVWFRAIYLMASTRCGISAKQLERETGVSYPTAHRMFKQIRSLLGQDGDGLFEGTVEVDEAYFGGKDKWKKVHDRKNRRGRYTGTDGKQLVVGVAERRGRNPHGRIHAVVAAHSGQKVLLPIIATKVAPDSMVYTDDWRSYDRVGDMGYEHRTISHSRKVYVSGDVHTNTVEGFWSLVKRGVSGVYHGVSTRYLQSYLDEYVFRYNNREATGRGMFDAFLSRIRKAPSAPAS